MATSRWVETQDDPTTWLCHDHECKSSLRIASQEILKILLILSKKPPSFSPAPNSGVTNATQRSSLQSARGLKPRAIPRHGYAMIRRCQNLAQKSVNP